MYLTNTIYGYSVVASLIAPHVLIPLVSVDLSVSRVTGKLDLEDYENLHQICNVTM